MTPNIKLLKELGVRLHKLKDNALAGGQKATDCRLEPLKTISEAADAITALCERVEKLEAAKTILTELLRLHDWRNELAKAIKEGHATEKDQRSDLLLYGRQEKAAWENTRAILKGEP